MASSRNIEMEAAKFLQKLIQDSKEEPAKLAIKLCVICQHMKLSGKEESLTYQVIYRAMETVIDQHILDIEDFKSSRLPLTGVPQTVEVSTNARSTEKDAPDNLIPAGASNMPFKGAPIGAWHAGSSSKMKEKVYEGSVQSVGAFRDSEPGLADNEVASHVVINPNKPPVGPSMVGSVVYDFYQGSVSQRSGNLYEHESPSSLDTRSANSQKRRDTANLDKQGCEKEHKKATAKRKRVGSTSDAHYDNLQQLETSNTRFKSKKDKITSKGDPQSHFTGKGGEHAHVNLVQSNGPMETSASSGLGSIFSAKQDNQSLLDRSMDKTRISNVKPVTPTSKYLGEGDVSAYGAAGAGQQKGGFFQVRHDIVNPLSVWDQFKVGLPSENSQLLAQSTATSLGTSKEAGTAGNEARSNINESKSSENKVFDFCGQISEGTILNKGGKFLQQRVPYPTKGPEKSPLAVNSNTSQGISAISGGFSKVHGGMPGSFSPYATIKEGFPASSQLNKFSVDSHELALIMHIGRGMEPSGSQLLEKNRGMMTTDTSMKKPSVEASSTRLAIDCEFLKDAEPNISEEASEVQLVSVSNGDEASAPLYGGKVVEQDGGTLHKIGNTYKMVQVVHFRSLEKPKEDDFCLELSLSWSKTRFKILSYDDVTKGVASHLGVDDSTKIRLTSHHCDPPGPRSQPIMYKGKINTSYNQTSVILYYEVLDTPLPELQGLKTLNVTFHYATKDEVMIRSITLPVDCTIGDLINYLKTKVELSHPNAELRLLGVSDCSIQKIFPLSEKIGIIDKSYQTLRAEEILEEEKNLGALDYLIHVRHHIKDLFSFPTDPISRTNWFQQHPQSFYEPLRINEGESLAKVKVRIQKKLQVPDDEFSKWKFKSCPSFQPSEYLQNSDIVSSCFQKIDDVYQHICLEHSNSDSVQGRADAANKQEKDEMLVPRSEYTEGSQSMEVAEAVSAAPTTAEVELFVPTSQSGEITPSPNYPGAGQLYEKAQHHQNILDEKFEDIGGFSVLKTQALLYKQLWLKYGHIASSQVLTASYCAQVMVVTDIMTSVVDMHQCHFANVSSVMIDEWERKIKMAEKLEFNIKWLRERFEDIKKDYYGEQKCKTSLRELAQSLQDALARVNAVKDELKKAQENLSALHTRISPLSFESRMYEPKGPRLLLDGLL